MSVLQFPVPEPDPAVREGVERVIAYQRADIANASEIPERYLGARIQDLSPRLGAAVSKVLESLPDVRAEIAVRVAAAIADGQPVLRAEVNMAAIRGFVSRARPLQLGIVGPKGVGKTYALSALLNAARTLFIPGRLVSITAIVKDIQATFDRAREEKTSAVLHRYENTPLLVLDDIDKMHITPWSASFLYDLVNSRSERFLPTFTSSNLSPDRVIAAISNEVLQTQVATALDRLRENAILLSVSGDSRR